MTAALGCGGIRVPLFAPVVGVTQTEEASMTKTLPADPDGMNYQRAQWAESALAEFQYRSYTDSESAFADLLCDLMHLADHNGWDFEAEMKRGRMHYEAETTGAETDLLAAARLVIERWSSGDLAEAVRFLESAVESAESTS